MPIRPCIGNMDELVAIVYAVIIQNSRSLPVNSVRTNDPHFLIKALETWGIKSGVVYFPNLQS